MSPRTRYIVFKKAEEGWTEIAGIEANDERQAKRLAFEALGLDRAGESVTLAACPERSWRPETVAVRLKPQLEFGADPLALDALDPDRETGDNPTE